MVTAVTGFPARSRRRPHGGPEASRRYERRRPEIFLDEVERLLCAAAGVPEAANTPRASRPRLGGISFLHRFGSALNHHVHLHACVTDGVFVPAAGQAGCDAPPTFLPARPVTAADLAALTERVRRRVIRWFRLARLLDAAAAADMLAWENSGFSIDASVRITLLDRDVPSVWRRHPSDLVHHGAGADPKDPHAPGRTTRTAAHLASSRPARRLGRARPGPRRPRHLSSVTRRAARDRHPQPLTAFHATVRTTREKSGFKAGLPPREKPNLERG
jgi:hypothetical protein